MNPLNDTIKRKEDRIEELENKVATGESGTKEKFDKMLKMIDKFCLECPINDTAGCHKCYLYEFVVRRS